MPASWRRPTSSEAAVLARSLGVLALLCALLAMLFGTRMIPWPEGGRYFRYEHDHDELMVSDTQRATRTITVVFTGRTGQEATYRPFGLTAQGVAVLARLDAG